MAGASVTEAAPRRRRHSSVGLILSDSQSSKLTTARNPDLRLPSALYGGEPSVRLSGARLVESGGKRADRLATSNGRMSRSGSDPKARMAPDSKIMVLGMAAVGKSALVVRFLTNRFIWEYDPTLESTYKHVTTIDEEPVVLEILDTAGQESLCQREGSARWADGYVLVYAINDRASFESLASLKQYLDDLKKTNVQCVLVANKSDLLHERRVESSEGEALAQDMACAFYETSASDGGSDITELFHELHREIKRRKMMETKGRRRSSAQQVRNVFNRVLNKIGSTS
ncbi:ras-related and estrogen-regulated growth inhibitor-like [Babylonia areolata]|uniref:ras-related and estrogen-regulated growth inhibitor-like n=1 Tax=Babylonia areolata TaxID=304850 RepID=UPI003FD53AE2